MSQLPFSVTSEDIATFRDWLQLQHFLPQDIDDNFIRAFIVSTKGSLQKAKVRFDHFFKSQQTLKEIFDDFDPLSTKMQNTNKHLAVCNIPGDDYTLIITKLLSEDHTYVSVTDYFLVQFFNTQTQLWDNTLGNCQVVYILDFSKAGLGHFKGLNPVLAERIVKAVIGASPVRFKSIHLLNLPSVLEWAINIFMQFIPEKLKQRLVVHSSEASLSDHVDMKYVPEDYGGLNKPVTYHHDLHLARLKFYREKFQEQKALREAEAKIRPVDEDEDTTATFRKLAID